MRGGAQGHLMRCDNGKFYVVMFMNNPQHLRVLVIEMLDRGKNVEEFAGMLVVEKWTGNANGRQAAFGRESREKKYKASFIDQGYCFNAGEWTFPDYPLRGVYARNEVYEGVRGWES